MAGAATGMIGLAPNANKRLVPPFYKGIRMSILWYDPGDENLGSSAGWAMLIMFVGFLVYWWIFLL